MLRMLIILFLVLSGKPLVDKTDAAGHEGAGRVLFVQVAEYAAYDGERLTLYGLSPQTTWFTDRPDRDVGSLSNTDFVAIWTEGKNSFANDPPNAVLNMANSDPVVIELLEPELAENALSYSVTPLNGAIPRTFEDAVLVIDGGCVVVRPDGHSSVLRCNVPD